MVTEDMRSYVGLGRLLYVLMTELEHDLRVADREPVLVANAPAQDEGVVVEAEVGRIHEQDFPDLNRRILERSDREGDVVPIGWLSHHLREVEQALARPEVVRSEHELATQVLKLVKRQAVGIGARLDLRDLSCPCRGLRRGDPPHRFVLDPRL
jgi:hypothetical protein